MHHVLRLNQVPISLSSSWPSLAAPQNSSPKVILSFSATLGSELGDWGCCLSQTLEPGATGIRRGKSRTSAKIHGGTSPG